MSDNIYLESKERLFKEYSHFSVKEKNAAKAFTNRQKGKYVGGVPLAYDSERDLIAIDSSDTHTLIWGSTGSLKTRCVIEPTVKIIGKSGESMIINDPKAEIHNRCAAELKDEGYKIIVINIRDPEFGNSWNPLAIPYRFYLSGDIDRAAEFANDVAHNLMMEESSTKDPFWDYSASDCLFGLILFLFRYAKDHNLDESAVNMSSLMKLRQQLFKNATGSFRPQGSLLWKYASEDELVEASLSGSVYAPNDTRNSILSTFDQKMRTFTIRPSLLDMLANNDIDIGEIGEEKCAVFLIIPDEKSTYNNLVSLFVKQAYEYLIYRAASNDDLKLNRRVNFVLDEFSSLPPISSMSTLISAARSRDIRFILAVQSKHQLIKRYGDEAETIKSNCVNWIYLTSREYDLLKEISDLCGEQRNHTPNMSVYDLQHFSKEKCEALVLCGRLKPAKVNLLDIDRFGDLKVGKDGARFYSMLEFERMPRTPRQTTDFELSDDIKHRLAPALGSNPFDNTSANPFSPGLVSQSSQSASAPVPNAFEKFMTDAKKKSVLDDDTQLNLDALGIQTKGDLDDVIRRIDQKIVELEAEEKAVSVNDKKETEGAGND